MRAHEINRLARDIGRHRFLFQDGEIAFDKEPAVEASDRRFDVEHIKQHGHAKRRPAARYGETDTGVLQRVHSVVRPVGQDLLFGDERAVHIGQHQRNPALPRHWSLHRSIERPPRAAITRQQLVGRDGAIAAGDIVRKVPRRIVRPGIENGLHGLPAGFDGVGALK